MLREIKPKNARSARALAARASLTTENDKKTLFLKGTSTSSLLTAILADLTSLKRPLAQRFTKKNAIHPFEDVASLEFFSQKNDASLLCFASHSKKRPHGLTFVRCFDGRVLDMMECGIVEGTARTLAQFREKTFRVGAKPLISFSGTDFEEATPGSKFSLAKSMFLDFFRGGAASEIDVEGLQWMISFAAGGDGSEDAGKENPIVRMRCWRILTKRSGQRLPRVELEEMGPRIDWKLGRIREAEAGMLKEALKMAKGSEAKPKKNVETDIAGDKMGRIHLGRQNLDELQTRKMKGLKRNRDMEELDDEAEATAGKRLDGMEDLQMDEDFDGLGEDEGADEVGGLDGLDGFEGLGGLEGDLERDLEGDLDEPDGEEGGVKLNGVQVKKARLN